MMKVRLNALPGSLLRAGAETSPTALSRRLRPALQVIVQCISISHLAERVSKVA